MSMFQDEATSTGTGSASRARVAGVVTHTVVLKGDGAVSATVVHQGNNTLLDDAGAWQDIWSTTLSGTDVVADTDTAEYCFLRVRVKVTALAGNLARVLSTIHGSAD